MIFSTAPYHPDQTGNQHTSSVFDPRRAGETAEEAPVPGLSNPTSFGVVALGGKSGTLGVPLLSQHLLNVDEQSLLDEREKLVCKKLEGEATQEGDRRLAFVRWHLDRIDEARAESQMSTLRRYVMDEDALARQIQGLVDKLSQVPRPARRARHR